MKADKKMFVGMFITFMLFWIVITGSFEVLQLAVGAMVSLMVIRFNRDILITSRERFLFTWGNISSLFRSALIFIVDVFKANLEVAWLVLNPRMPIKPSMVRFKVNFKKDVSRVILANAITLTPGTLSVLCDEEEFLVHVITEKNAREVSEWYLIKELERMEE